ncbi:tetratricopeptide repeat protein [Winogradskyella alexanderae]|uniref:Tetratricopeptide repeat protein n=1 Tax=Winogradskyella alexanderae TaxID=2877123 RepID=A0ABS7XS04_9FLAO|nr:tetratricopeptide repeat protein [Winogradskyella alexanderae]MCA0132796.1 tetratricopeptide repeat protein [Winogradskyella alexanderae]
MILRIRFICFLLFALCINAQQKSKIDSLLNVKETTSVDSIKLKTLNKITSYYLYRDIKKAKEYAFKQQKLSEQLNQLEYKIKSSHHIAVIYNILSKHDSARYYIDKTIKLSYEANNLEQVSISNHSLANLEISLGNLDKAEEINSKNLEFNKKLKDSFAVALSYDLESSIYINREQYQLALKSVLNSLEMVEALNKRIRIADAQNKLAVIENSLENFDSSIEYSEQALEIYKEYEDIEYQSQIYNILGISYKFKKDYTKAKAYFNKSINISEPNGYLSILIVSKSHLIDIYMESQDYPNAKKLIDECLEIADSIGYDAITTYSNLRLAKYYNKMGNYNKSQKLLDQLLTEGNLELEGRANAYLTKSETFKLQNNYLDALHNYELHKKYQDSVLKRKSEKQINELRIIHKTEQKEAELVLQEEEIKTLNAQAENDKLTKLLYGGGAVAGILTSGLLLFGFRQRIKKNKIEREKQEEIYKHEIAFKKKELASQTLHLVQKNTFIQELKENLEKIKKSPELFKIEFRRLVMLLKKESAEDKDWEVFKSYFSEVHNNFDQKIKSFSSDITEKEIRLASFLRMNLTTKEIASMLNVLPDSVLKSKYRLKKKLNLEKDLDLTQFLNSL